MLSDSDWELINAFADGELTVDEAAKAARRLATEPALAAALSEIRFAKSRLASLRPVVEREAPAVAPRAGRRFAAAACIAAMLGVGAAYQIDWWGQDWTDAPANLHHLLSGNTYVLPESYTLPVISTARIGDVRVFDLSSSRLFLVDVQSSREAGRDVVAMHYRGLNGCRLTVVAVESMSGDPAELPARHEGLGERWTVERIHFYLLTSGMDRDRFDAIATFAKLESHRRDGGTELRLAMSEATAQARPCA